MDDVTVNLDSAGYRIHIDNSILREAGVILQQLRIGGKILVISDDNVGKIYGQQILAVLAAAGFTAELFPVSPGESSKSLQVAQTLYTKAISLGLDRKSAILALGGGVVGDLAGFVAATYLRGIPFIQVPTSLLAQVDSSVGGKVAVNHELGKNLIGAFYQPRTVIIDINTLNSLPERELYTGLAEVIKYGLIADAAFLNYLEGNNHLIFGRDNQALRYIVQRSCELKAAIVEEDEKESGLRIILNFGHTIAHAVEAVAGYGKYNHGEAVAIGMHGAVLLSCALKLCSRETVDTVRHLISRYHLPLYAQDCDAAALFSLLSRDKKTIAGKVNWVLLTAIGKTVVRSDVPEQAVQQVLAELTDWRGR